MSDPVKPKPHWCKQLSVVLLIWTCVLFAVLAILWMFWASSEKIKSVYGEWEDARSKLPTNPPTWITTRDVTIQYRVLVIEGSEYILAQDRNGSYISLCPKIK